MSKRNDSFFDGPRPAGGSNAPSLYLAADRETAPAAEPTPEWQKEAQGDIGNPLLQAMVWLTQHYGLARSAESLLAGASVDGTLGPDQAMRMMREAGYNAGLVRRKIDDLNPLLMPSVLLLNDGDACVLVRRLDAAQPQPEGRYEVLFPGAEANICTASSAELEGEYSGFTMLVTPQEKSQAHTRSDPHLRNHGPHWFWGTVKRFIPYYRAAMLAALLSNVLMLVSGLVTSVIYDKVIPNQSFVTLWTLAIGAALALVFDLFARQLRAHLIDLAGRKVDLIVGAKLFRQSLGVRMEFKPSSAGAYAHTIGQVECVREFFTSASMSVVSDLPFIIIFIGMTFIVGGPLGWVPALAVPVILGISLLMQKRMRAAVNENMGEMADLHGTLVEAVEGLEDLKTSGAEGRFLRRYETTSAAAAESAMRSRDMHAWNSNLSSTLQQAITMIMLVWGVYLIKDGVVTAGALIGAVMFAGRAIAPLSMVVSLAARYQGARAAMSSLDLLMEKPTERESDRNYVPLNKFSGSIALNDVGFAYPAEGNAVAPKVLKNVTLKIRAGERVAILGRIGSGKSTVLRMMASLYQPSEGMVEVDGIDLRQVDPAEFRARVGFVSQDPRLFHGSLRDNVLMGRAHIDASRLVEVARLTGLDRVVAAHPMGWDLPVGEQGCLLSGGQRQLVALARSLISKPQVLLMDEPTSSMDAQSEVSFLRQLRDAAGECTLVMVTHRPAVLELVSRITVMDSGRVVMDGPRDQVLAALSGVRPTQPASSPEAQSNLHMHPAAQPVQRSASV
ncbi:type I secretion system permease/ATPase [Paucibacter sp. Y2R2-4]|uniref:type I secretion system permease/ATPase n=1 Tax=Paucibacter sp. Y2R2-4 TaxID=2893553 RepID=UPI0021E4A70C|nr:type I secretion system permease/ATPase [Paucibacter sp. Y2R2-4]MCV2348152.1 type I secretion system permease/ATPase [Paucibacter sp. Y2R2-4]